MFRRLFFVGSLWCYYYCCQALIGKKCGQVWMSWLPLASCVNATRSGFTSTKNSPSWPSPAQPASQPTSQRPTFLSLTGSRQWPTGSSAAPKRADEPTSEPVKPLPHSLSLVSSPDASGPLIPYEWASRLPARMPYIAIHNHPSKGLCGG